MSDIQDVSSERKLASIRTISAIDPIPNSDNIEVATIDGWKVVVKKNEYKVGDKIVYFEIDSWLPIRPEYEFLHKSSYRELPDQGAGYRIKTIKLRGQISQGLVMPIDIIYNQPTKKVWWKRLLETVGFTFSENYSLEDGTDYTKHLGVRKWDPDAGKYSLGGDQEGKFPFFIPKTDQERIQNRYNKIKDTSETFEVSLKLDGTSMTVYFYNGKFGVCSRNWQLKEGDNAYWRAVYNSCIDVHLKQLGRNLAVQGEVMGVGIQKNRENLDGLTFFVYDVYDIDQKRYLLPQERLDVVFKLCQKHVPIIHSEMTINDKSLDDLLAMADIKSINNPVAEGIVFKSNYNSDKACSFKVINNKYLINED